MERVIREVKEDFLAWLTGQVFPERPTLAWHDAMARRWTTEIVAARRHRTTGRGRRGVCRGARAPDAGQPTAPGPHRQTWWPCG